MTENRDADADDRELALVTEATKRATQDVASKNRHRLVGWGFGAGLAVACLVAIPTTAAITHHDDRTAAQAEHREALHNSRVNCRLVATIAKAQLERIVENKAATVRFKKESLDRFGLSPQKFEKLIQEGEARERRQLAAYQRVADVDCATAIT